MNAEKSENASDGSNGRTLRIRVAATGTSKESGQLRSTDPVSQEARNLEVARIPYQPLQTEEHDLAVQRRRDDLARLLIKIRRGEAGYALAKKFLDENQGLPPETGGQGLTYDPRS
jgi:hypothetical protein